MEWMIIVPFVLLVFYLNTTGWMKAFRIRFALPILLIGYPVFFYFVILPNFSWLKLLFFLVMLGGFLYTFFNQKNKPSYPQS